jgi:hypothetical protein
MDSAGRFSNFEGDPGRLWSLWDMLNHDAEAFCRFSSILGQAIIGLRFNQKPDLNVMISTLKGIRLESNKIGLSSVVAQVNRIEEYTTSNSPDVNQWQNMLFELYNRLRDDLSSRSFLSVMEESAKYYKQTEPLFGLEVASKFPCVAYEIEEAGKCFALDRSTASAFHSIRCLEAAIRSLSRCLGIPDPTRASGRSWGALLKDVKDEIDKRWPGSSTRMSGDGEFFDSAYAALAAMQNPWRNATMHLDQKYTPDEAIHVMEVVKGFMKKLASRMDEDGKPLA